MTWPFCSARPGQVRYRLAVVQNTPPFNRKYITPCVGGWLWTKTFEKYALWSHLGVWITQLWSGHDHPSSIPIFSSYASSSLHNRALWDSTPDVWTVWLPPHYLGPWPRTKGPGYGFLLEKTMLQKTSQSQQRRTCLSIFRDSSLPPSTYILRPRIE